MLSAAAFVLDRLTLRNICLAYFVLAPFFLNQAERMPVLWVFMAGHAVTAALLGLFVCRKLAAFDHTFRPDRLTFLVLGLLGAAFASVLANGPTTLLRPDKIALWYVKLAFPALSFLVMVTVLRPRDVPLLFGLLCGVCAFSVIVVGLQAATGFPTYNEGRFTAFYYDPNGYVFLLNAVLAFLLPALFSRMRQGRPLGLLVAANLLLFGMIGLTGSRGGLLVSIVLLGLSILATRAWRTILPMSLAAIPVLIVFTMATLSSRTAAGAAMSDLGRLWTYMVALEIVKENPFFGVGYGGVVDVFMQYGRQYYLLMGKVLDTHNAYLGIMAETGAPGLVLFGILIFWPIATLGKRVVLESRGAYPVVAQAGLNLSVSFSVYGLFYPHFLGHDDFWVYYAMVILILRALNDDPGAKGYAGFGRNFPFAESEAGRTASYRG